MNHMTRRRLFLSFTQQHEKVIDLADVLVSNTIKASQTSLKMLHLPEQRETAFVKLSIDTITSRMFHPDKILH